MIGNASNSASKLFANQTRLISTSQFHHLTATRTQYSLSRNYNSCNKSPLSLRQRTSQRRLLSTERQNTTTSASTTTTMSGNNLNDNHSMPQMRIRTAETNPSTISISHPSTTTTTTTTPTTPTTPSLSPTTLHQPTAQTPHSHLPRPPQSTSIKTINVDQEPKSKKRSLYRYGLMAVASLIPAYLCWHFIPSSFYTTVLLSCLNFRDKRSDAFRDDYDFRNQDLLNGTPPDVKSIRWRSNLPPVELQRLVARQEKFIKYYLYQAYLLDQEIRRISQGATNRLTDILSEMNRVEGIYVPNDDKLVGNIKNLGIDKSSIVFNALDDDELKALNINSDSVRNNDETKNQNFDEDKNEPNLTLLPFDKKSTQRLYDYYKDHANKIDQVEPLSKIINVTYLSLNAHKSAHLLSPKQLQELNAVGMQHFAACQAVFNLYKDKLGTLKEVSENFESHFYFYEPQGLYQVLTNEHIILDPENDNIDKNEYAKKQLDKNIKNSSIISHIFEHNPVLPTERMNNIQTSLGFTENDMLELMITLSAEEDLKKTEHDAANNIKKLSHIQFDKDHIDSLKGTNVSNSSKSNQQINEAQRQLKSLWNQIRL